MTRNVILYSSTNCPECIKTKNLLKDEGIKFMEYDVSTEAEKAVEMIKISGRMTAPVLIINDNVIIGYNEDLILSEAKKIKKT